MRTLIATGSVLLLAAFAPPQRAPDSLDGIQQGPPKSWIPDPPPKGPPLTFETLPAEPSEPAPDPVIPGQVKIGTECNSEKVEMSAAFSAAVDAADEQHKSGDYEAALKSADMASALANSDLQKYLVDVVRGEVFKSMRNRQGYEATLKSLISRDCFLLPGEREIWQEYLDALLGRTDL
jgi:hypothetical protein